MNCQDHLYRHTHPGLLARRWFLQQCGVGLGAAALSSLLGCDAHAADATQGLANPLAPKQPHYPARAKRVIFLFMAGAQSSRAL